jgi:molybdopterin converting factor small subunit
VTIEVRLFATLAEYLPRGTTGESAVLDLRDGLTVAAVIAQLGIPPAMPRIVLVNGEDADDDRALETGDVLSVFPPLAGGR